MSSLVKEAHAIQNPALGATLQWAFVQSYGATESAAPTPLPLLFVALPVLLHAKSLELLTSTQAASGIRKFEFKFRREKCRDMLNGLHDRMISMKRLSLASLSIGIHSGLVALSIESGAVTAEYRGTIPKTGKSVQRMLRAAGKLGAWFQSESLEELCTILKIEI